MCARQSESRSKGLTKPFDGSGKWYFEDEAVVALNKAILERDKTQTAARIARAEKTVESGMLQLNLMQSRLHFSKEEISQSKTERNRLATEARGASAPLAVTHTADSHRPL